MSVLEIAISNLEEVNKGLERRQANLIKAVNATTSDFKSRGPGWISQEITKKYTIKKKDVTAARKGSRTKGHVNVAGIKLNNIVLEYRGTLLTPVHFKMTPKRRPAKAYRINVEIRKGTKTRFPRDVFLADNGSGTHIPFQREGMSRLPIKATRSVSIPQMITNKEVGVDIKRRINDELEKRLQHNIERFNQ